VRKGDFVGTYKGNEFWPLDPRVEEVDVIDIAHSLSQICRFNGHTLHFWSIAQHSLLVEQVIKEYLNWDSPLTRLYGLLHDASEAYISDICRPVKKYLQDYLEIEGKIERAILEYFQIADKLTSKDMELVIKADNIVLALEGRKLMKSRDYWNISQLWKPEYEPLLKYIDSSNISDVEQRFIEKCKALTNELGINISWEV